MGRASARAARGRGRWALTPTGFRVLVVAAACAPAAYVFALPELFAPLVVVAAGMVLTAIGWLLRRGKVVARRSVPRRCAVGETIDGTLEVAAIGRRSGVLSVLDGDDPEGPVLFDSIPRGSSTAVRTSATPTRRGTHRWGPARVEQVDPIGLLRRRRFEGAVDDTLVWPRLHRLALTPDDAHHPDEEDMSHWYSATRRSDEFAGLRPHQPGDDIRHVHWAAVARTGSLVVRHFEQPDSTRGVVVLDDRRDTQTPAAFERSVEAAAAVVDVLVRTGRWVRLVTASGRTTAEGEGDDVRVAAMDALALAEMVTTGDLAETALRFVHEVGGLVVWCCHAARPADVERLASGRSTARLLVADSAADATSSRARTPTGHDVTVLACGDPASLQAAWNAWGRGP